MSILFKLLIFFWIIISVKQILFWIYLWQLKEYHIPRFKDHFRTAKGKSLIFNKLRFLKIIFLILFIVSLLDLHEPANSYLLFLFFAIFCIYFIESILFLKQIIAGNIKKPKFTKKTVFLTLVSFFVFVLFLIKTQQLVYILTFDIMAPVVVSIIVLLFQPFAVISRNRILKKAKLKMESQKNLIVIGITGSYGKTTTKEFLTTILSGKFKTLSTKEHKNSEMGIAQTILSKEFDRVFGQETTAPIFNEKIGAGPSTKNNFSAAVFIVEMGAYKKGGIKLLCDMVKPRIGIVTGVTVQHLSLFGSLENLLSAEGGWELADSLSRWQNHRGSSTGSGPKNGFILVNGENKYCIDLYKKIKGNKLIYTEMGNKIESDIYAKNIEVSKNNLSFVAVAKDKHAAHFKVNILGKHNLQNILGAILIAKELGMTMEQISKAAENIKPEQAGIVVKKGAHGINVIDSSYSSNPDGVLADLGCLELFEGKRVVIMPCLIELGRESRNVHQKIGEKIADTCDLAIITTKERIADIKKGAALNKMNPEKVIFMDSSEEIFHKITTFCKEGDVVLLEGRVPGKLIKLLEAK